MRPEPLAERVLTCLTIFHCGRHAGITADDLAHALDASPRRVRRAVTLLREQGTPICGTPETGYFRANTREELAETCQFLRHRALTSLTLEARLRRLPLSELLGQVAIDLKEETG
ncbi:MAG TPA: HTH domain-containing protein [bacterium]|jgi:predicted DNA-binding transcriptional regulator YafY